MMTLKMDALESYSGVTGKNVCYIKCRMLLNVNQVNISDGLFVILILDRNSKPYYCSPLCQLVFHRFSYQPKLALPTMDEVSSDPEIMDSEYIVNPEEVDTDTA